jgi:hypothetical protein
VLNGLGLVMIHRLDLGAATQAIDTGQGVAAADAPRQVPWTAVALGLFVTVLWRVGDHRRLACYGYTFGLVGLGLLVLPGVLPASISEINGAKLWLRLGPLSIQPGEFAKIGIIVFVAVFLVTNRELFTTAGRQLLGITFPRPRDLAPLLTAWGLSIGVLTLEKELGASLLIFGVVLVMLYTATERLSWVLIRLVFFAASCVLAYQLFAHVRIRVHGLIPSPATTSRLPSRPITVRTGHRRPGRHRPRRRPTRAGPGGQRRLHHGQHRRRTRPDRIHRSPGDLPAADHPRLAGRAVRPRPSANSSPPAYRSPSPSRYSSSPAASPTSSPKPDSPPPSCPTAAHRCSPTTS